MAGEEGKNGGAGGPPPARYLNVPGPGSARPARPAPRVGVGFPAAAPRPPGVTGWAPQGAGARRGTQGIGPGPEVALPHPPREDVDPRGIPGPIIDWAVGVFVRGGAASSSACVVSWNHRQSLLHPALPTPTSCGVE